MKDNETTCHRLECGELPWYSTEVEHVEMAVVDLYYVSPVKIHFGDNHCC